jgi:outer membrane protein assembly factor BamD (BamD/ComL family)
LEWGKTIKLNNQKAYIEFLEKYPNSKFSQEAKN